MPDWANRIALPAIFLAVIVALFLEERGANKAVLDDRVAYVTAFLQIYHREHGFTGLITDKELLQNAESMCSELKKLDSGVSPVFASAEDALPTLFDMGRQMGLTRRQTATVIEHGTLRTYCPEYRRLISDVRNYRR